MFNTENKKNKTENKNISWARKALRPEFNRSFLNIKVAVDSFVRLVASIFLNSGLLDEEDSVFDYNRHLGFADFGEIVAVAAKNINWKSIHSIPQICLWLSSVLLIVFAISLLIVLLMGIVSGVSMAANPPLDATYDDLFTLSQDMQKTEYGTTWINWLFSLTGENRPILNGQNIPFSGLTSGFRSMLVYYSSSCLVLGSIMVSYLFVNVVIDTASTGKFMGQHDEVWAFPRILMAMAFLVPYGTSGLNIGQHVVIYLAKTGSVFATNAWLAFLTGMDSNKNDITVISRDDISLEEMADVMFDSYVCYWGTQLGSQVMTAQEKSVLTEAKNYQKSYLKQLENKRPKHDLLPITGCYVGKLGGILPGYQYYRFQQTESFCKMRIDWATKDGSAEEQEALTQFDNTKQWINEYNNAVDELSNEENSSESSMVAIAMNSKPVVYYRYNIGGIPISDTCGTYAAPSVIGNAEGDNLEVSFNSLDCTKEKDLASMFFCTKKKMSDNMKYAYISAFNDENVLGFRKEALPYEKNLLLQPIKKENFDTKAFTLGLPTDVQKSIQDESEDEDVKLRDKKEVYLPKEGSLSSYAFDAVYKIFEKSKYNSIIPDGLELINGDSDHIMTNSSIIRRAKYRYINRFKDNMQEGIDGANKAFSELNTTLFGRNSDGSWKTKDIGTQISKGWISAGAFYSLLSKINGLGLEVKGLTPYVSGPSNEFIGNSSVDIENYNPEKTDEKEGTVGNSSKIKYLDYVMTLNEKIKNNAQKSSTGRSAREGISSSYAGVSMMTSAISAFGLDNMLTNMDGANPISQLVSLGHYLINTAITVSMANTIANFLAGSTDEMFKSLSASGVFGSGIPFALARFASWSLRSLYMTNAEIIKPLAMSYLGFGFILAYYLPLLPFIRFTLGAVGWFAAVFQAVLGMPMLMLGSISTSKGGIILGPQRGKYMMIVEIFFRPILMVFGMIGAILILSLATYIFTDLYNFAWGVSAASADATYISPTTLIAGFAYVGIYVSTMYTIANTSFKMIDDVPQQVISWMGGGAGYNMGGPEAVLGAAEKGIQSSASKTTELQGGLDKGVKSRLESKSNKEKDMNNDINDIQNTMVKDGPQSAQLSADLKGYKIVDGKPVINKDKKSAQANLKRAREHLDSGGTAKDYMKDNKPKPKPNDMDDDGGTPS